MRMSRTKNDYIHVCVCVYLTPDIVYLESLRRLAEFGTWYVLLINFHRNLAADQPRLFPQRRSYRSDSCWHILPKEERKWRLLLICQPKCDSLLGMPFRFDSRTSFDFQLRKIWLYSFSSAFPVPLGDWGCCPSLQHLQHIETRALGQMSFPWILRIWWAGVVEYIIWWTKSTWGWANPAVWSLIGLHRSGVSKESSLGSTTGNYCAICALLVRLFLCWQ